jgi:hypothetical protein
MPSGPRVIDRIQDQADFAGALTDGYYLSYSSGTGKFSLAAVSVPVASVFGRTGAVAAQSGDYSVAQVTGAAPLASPTFTGTPAAPTAAGGTSTTQLATTAFVAAALPAAANPSASVGLSAVNGSASTFLRSDGAPALSQAIAPTWTGEHVFAAPSGTVKAAFRSAASDESANWWEAQDSNSAVSAYLLPVADGGFFGARFVLQLSAATGFAASTLVNVSTQGTTYASTTSLLFVGRDSNGGAIYSTRGAATAAGLYLSSNGSPLVGSPASAPALAPYAGDLTTYLGTPTYRFLGVYTAQVIAAPGAAGTSPIIARGTTSQTGVLVQLQGQSSTTAAREQADIDTAWVTSTDATRKARLILRAWDTAAREGIRIEASGSAPMLGFFGVAAVSRPGSYTPANVTTDRSYDADATTLAEVADVLGTLIADLQSLGLIS